MRVPRHPGRRPGPGRRRRRRPPPRAAGGAAPAPIPSGGAPGDRLAYLRDVRRPAHRGARSRSRRRLPVRRSTRPRLPVGRLRPRSARPARPPVDAARPAGVHLGGTGGRGHDLQCPRPAGRARPPPLRLLFGVGGGDAQRGRRGPPRPRYQAVPVPDVGRQSDRGRPGAGGRAGQAGRRAGRSHSALRRGGQHRMGPRPRGGGRPRHLRTDGSEDPCEDHAGGAPGRRRRTALLPCRYRQLQPEDGPDVRGPGRPVLPARARAPT